MRLTGFYSWNKKEEPPCTTRNGSSYETSYAQSIQAQRAIVKPPEVNAHGE